MAITIVQEAKRDSRLVYDIDNMRRRYQSTEGDIVINFVSPYFSVYEKYRFYLLKNSVREVLESKYYFRPDYLSYQKYNTTTLWTLLLFINDIPNIENFNKNQVLIPTFTSILNLSRGNTESTKVSDLNELNKAPVARDTLNLYTTKSTPKLIDIVDEVEPAEEVQLHYVRQKFDVTFTDVSNKYVDLGFANPIAESVELTMQGETSFIYGVDYVLKADANDVVKRLSWKADSDNSVIGLESTIIEDAVLEIRYAIPAS